VAATSQQFTRSVKQNIKVIGPTVSVFSFNLDGIPQIQSAVYIFISKKNAACIINMLAPIAQVFLTTVFFGCASKQHNGSTRPKSRGLLAVNLIIYQKPENLCIQHCHLKYSEPYKFKFDQNCQIHVLNDDKALASGE
jgi:hypothetical protein